MGEEEFQAWLDGQAELDYLEYYNSEEEQNEK